VTDPISNAEQRYLDTPGCDAKTNWDFFGSKQGNLTGLMEIQRTLPLLNESYQETCWQVIDRISNEVDYPI
jgi:hypothetical protein